MRRRVAETGAAWTMQRLGLEGVTAVPLPFWGHLGHPGGRKEEREGVEEVGDGEWGLWKREGDPGGGRREE